MVCGFVYVFGNGRGESYPEDSSIGKLIRAALEELGTVFFPADCSLHAWHLEAF